MMMGDTNQAYIHNVSAAFQARGLRELIVCRDGEQLRKFMDPLVDVVMCDIDLPGINFCPMVQLIRQNLMGMNPFTVMMATGRASTSTDMRQVVKSGIDDFLLKTSPADMLVRRVHAFAEARKPFVVTGDYIGPNRRPVRRDDGSDDDLIEVPNTLRSRLVDGARLSEVQEIIQKALGGLADKKSGTQLKCIVRLIKRFLRQYVNSGGPDEMRRTLELLAAKCEAMSAEHEGKRTDSVAEITECIARLALRLAKAPEQTSKVEASLMRRLCDALQVSFTAATGANAVAQQIAATVNRFLEQN